MKLSSRTVIRHALDQGALSEAVALLRRGRLVAFPTDTVYGLGVVVWDAKAIAQLFAAKDRRPDKAIPVLVADAGDLRAVAGSLPWTVLPLVERFWPGPLTLVVPKGKDVPAVLTGGGDTVAVRMPDHPVALALIQEMGTPLAVTSANLADQGSPLDAEGVLQQLDGRIDLILDAGPCAGGVPSTVIDLTSDRPRVLRAGPVSTSALADALGGGEVLFA